MVGVAGKSKACHTCKKRRIRVSTAPVAPLQRVILCFCSVIFKSQAAEDVSMAASSVKAMSDGWSLSIGLRRASRGIYPRMLNPERMGRNVRC